MIDLDRFKPVNDTYGHIIGDKLLSEVGARLAIEAGRDVVVARLGGDEFGFIASDPASFKGIGQRICDHLSRPYSIEGIGLTIGCSCGMASFPESGETAAELFDHSDYALYISKSAREGQAVLYSAEHEKQVRSEKAIALALKAANLEDELEIYFQPIIDIKSNKVRAVEALARWTSPTLGRIPPNLFIGCAERMGLIHEVTLALFKKALTHLHRLPADLKLSFNLSAHDVTSQRTIVSLIGMMKGMAVEPSRIVFEITETAVMRDFEVAAQSISLLRRMGVQLALDDFGTGQSSLGYLHRLTIDKVKIDRTFVAGLGELSGRKIIQSIVGLCQTLDLECIVEGVEKESQVKILQGLGCTTIQGFLIAPPMPIEEFLRWSSAPSSTHRTTASSVTPVL
jgi:diguanylate cyclase (GGDEF)-like protein